MSQGIFRAAVMYNLARGQYIKIDPETSTGDPSLVEWSWEDNPNNATKWNNLFEFEYFLTSTPIGDPTINSYPWEYRWMYFST